MFKREAAPKLYEFVGQPCRNFNILGQTSLIDPLDGKEKHVLSNFALGGTGTVVIIDTLTGEGEQHELPIGNGAWGIVNWNNEKLVIGTCVEQAYLHVLDLRTRTWAEPLKSIGESYFWKMGLGSDGKVYGGTYPGCSLMQYDPATHTLVNLGKVSENPKNLYSRPVWGEAPGYIFVYYGFDTKGLKVYDIAKGTFQEFGRPEAEIREINDRFICTRTNGQLDFYDPQTLQPLDDAGLADQLKPSKITLANGQQLPFIELEDDRLASFRGQDYFIVDKPSSPQDYDTPQPIALAQIPAKAPVTEIFTLVEDPKGQIWGASGFGQTIFRFDPATGEYWNSSSVCNEGGEVYGMVFVGDRLFTASYVGGDHTVYDPDQPWDQLNNVNPHTLRSVGPQLIRPEGRSVLGPDGGIWTGWSANYGVYGGGLSRVDPETLEVESWYDPIPERAIASVAADDQYVYFTTHSGTSGLATRHDIPWQLGIWEPGKGLIDQYDYPASPNETFGIAASQGKVAFAAGTEIHIFDVAERKVVHTVSVSQPCLWLLKLDDEHVAAFCGDELIRIHLHSGEASLLSLLPGTIRAATLTAAGDIYFSVRTSLYVIRARELSQLN
ncbi:hypothetical protein [Cohnella hashimotonis]|uniref:WD40 repeat domain-containing protein n=1 Tax=Cohnella hashimotonis TaxID=2826895 RepID=A0ABT6TEQ4_9BACL|nr:hypothetical protein [Cohnella hashimotonis]MDI4645031.1 hypothetical protein [Cohnella hashimotonis]